MSLPLKELLGPYLLYRERLGSGTVNSHRVYLKKHFLAFLDEQGQSCVENLNADLLKDFWESLAFKRFKRFKRKTASQFYAITTRNQILNCVKQFCAWLVDENYLAQDPSKRIEYSRAPQRLPKDVLSEKEIFLLLDSINMTTTLGFRDRVIMELFYGTGIRKSELRMLKVSDADLDGGFLFIEQGKGKKDRVVPLGKGLCKLIHEYLLFIRPKLCSFESNPYLLITYQRKGPLSDRQVNKRVKICAEKAMIKKNVYPHLLRHCCATHMIRRGAPLRHIQELLGHSCVVSTQLYTHLTIIDLKKAHAKYHPREQMMTSTNESPAHPSNKGGP